MEQTLEGALARGDAADPALIVPDGPRLTYRQLRARVTELAERLAGMGVERGDRVAIVHSNGAEAIVAFLAAATVATAAPLNPAYTEAEFRFSLEDSGARVLLTGPGQAAAARAALPAGGLVIEPAFRNGNSFQVEAQTPRSNPVDNHSEPPPILDSLTLGGPPRGWGRDGAESGGAADPSADDVALVLHTSGTTSRPKRVPLRHRNLAASVDNIVRSYHLGPNDVSLCAMPLFHVHGLVASALATFGAGGTVVAPALDHPLGLLPLLASQRVTWFSGSPTLHRLLLRRVARGGTGAGDRPPFPALRFVRSCSAALPLDQFHEMEAAYGVPVLEAYGMTEASHQMTSNPLPPAERIPGSVGVATGIELAAMDEDGRLLGPGEPGEVVIRGPNVVDGYEGNPEATAAAFRDGWFRTGDLGWIGHGGYLHLVGRLKELINRGGEKIAPLEVDSVLEAHPAVAEAVTFGVPHPAWGEDVAAAVVLREPVSDRELLAWCRARLAAFKVPRTLHVVDAIPRTPTGKVQRGAVAEWLATKAGPGAGNGNGAS